MVNIAVSHTAARGSIPRIGIYFFFYCPIFSFCFTLFLNPAIPLSHIASQLSSTYVLRADITFLKCKSIDLIYKIKIKIKIKIK